MRLSKRALLASAADRLGVVSLALKVRRSMRPRTLTVVNYHRVNHPDAARDFDPGTLDATPEGLDRQLSVLRREFTLLGPDELIDHVQGRPWPANPAVVTFDDGYRDNFEQALPILQRHGLKAFFFVATDFIANRRLFWWDRISYTLKHSKRSRLSITYPHARELDLTHGVDGPLGVLLGLVKSSFGLDVDRFLSGLAAAADVAWDAERERALADELLMTWSQVRGLSDAGMEIGSHTRKHRVLTTLPPSELASELEGSRADLEAVLGKPVRAIAYPASRSLADAPALLEAVRAAGYQLGFGYGKTTQPLDNLDPLGIERLAVDASWSLGRFRAAVTFSRLG